ncbi:hypothetical protein E3V36_04565 [Candidatus Marinimicrobia bacterium MT.SAG.2]|nr:hypothetical protein E3V36_04565 [Candidatus Marinimicrobia bacterium MT.SAG.2]
MSTKKSEIRIQRLRVRLFKTSVKAFEETLKDSVELTKYDLLGNLGFDGTLFISKPTQGTPAWLQFMQSGTQNTIEVLSNQSNSAVLLVKIDENIYGIAFGHGRHLLKEELLVQDFGIKVSLNGIEPASMRSIDTFTIEEQTVHKRTQSSRASGIEIFGLDISRDIVRAITGIPKNYLRFESLAGSDATVAVSARMEFSSIEKVCKKLNRLYKGTSYQSNFAWVDHIKKVKESSKIKELDKKLIDDINDDNPTSYLAPPEPINWVDFNYFSFTQKGKNQIFDLNLASYRQNLKSKTVDTEKIKRDHAYLFSSGLNEAIISWSIYNCLTYEVIEGSSRFVFTKSTWFEIEKSFAEKINNQASKIEKIDLKFPQIEIDKEGKIEREDEYNIRAAKSQKGIALMDKKLAKCESTSTYIEICDLMSEDQMIIHVKKKKGGSSGLSHLFAQGRISGEALLNDKAFRKKAKLHLGSLSKDYAKRIPEDGFISNKYKIVYVILGVDPATVVEDLPFFSLLNLVGAKQFLTSIGYQVAIAGISVKES